VFDEPIQEEIDDAIIEDTVHCDFCGAGWTLGGHEGGICLNLPMQTEGRIGTQLKLCVVCAMEVSRVLQMNLDEKDICEHGVCAGDWCEPCNQAYKEARIANGYPPEG
jgi:hypothetical protein